MQVDAESHGEWELYAHFENNTSLVANFKINVERAEAVDTVSLQIHQKSHSS